MTMKFRMLFAAMIAATLVACQGPGPESNAQASLPDQSEEANLPALPETNQAGQNVSTAEVTPVAEQPKSCEEELGKKAAGDLVRRCLNVSPATHPPCNTANACEMIRQEIDRSCAMFGDNKPADCKPEAQ